jgi:hypothetical protein
VPPAQAPSRVRRSLLLAGVILALYAVAAYLIVPAWWRIDESHHPALENAPTITHTGAGIPGDPLNIALVGAEEQMVRGMLKAGWHPADPITLRSSERIAVDTILHREYADAPVSDLYLFDRKQDFAFEMSVGDDPRKRHHVRLWKALGADPEGRPLWLGAATYDERVGFSHTTGEITHHIGPDIDAERDLIVKTLTGYGLIERTAWLDRWQPSLSGENGGGDPWHTDGRLGIVVLRP